MVLNVFCVEPATGGVSEIGACDVSIAFPRAVWGFGSRATGPRIDDPNNKSQNRDCRNSVKDILSLSLELAGSFLYLSCRRSSGTDLRTALCPLLDLPVEAAPGQNLRFFLAISNKLQLQLLQSLYNREKRGFSKVLI
jgi:hypothetical protein